MGKHEKTPLEARIYTLDELISRAFLRVAKIIIELHKESPGYCPTTLLNEPLILDEYVEVGTSINGGGRREHVVPRKWICDEATEYCKKKNQAQNTLRNSFADTQKLCTSHVTSRSTSMES